MKKIVLTLGICILLIAMPTALSLQLPSPNQHMRNPEKTNISPIPEPVEDPPDWANGNFTGVWGIDIWGETQIPIGWLFGYYRHINFGYFYGVFDDFFSDNDSNFIQGFFVGPFMFGSLGNESSANDTIFVGLGSYNETHFYWRIMGMTGPTFFMYGEYTKFER